MNELLGPIYHVFATSKRREWAAWAEADAFFCFVSLMSENRDVYTKSLDNSADGIEGKFKQLNQASQLTYCIFSKSPKSLKMLF